MDKSIGLEFNNNNVRQLELLADGLESILLKKDTIETDFSLIMLNIESFIPNSNIFEYIFKTDISKRDKIKILIGRGKQYEKIKIIDNKIEQIVNEIEEKAATIRIEENKLNNEHKLVEKTYEKIKIIDNKIEQKAATIRIEENKLNNEHKIIEKIYEKIKIIDNKIEQLVGEIQEKTLLIRNEENELNDEYTVINKMNSKLSNMDNQINESEWRVYQGSGERALFDFLKNKLIVEKKLIK